MTTKHEINGKMVPYVNSTELSSAYDLLRVRLRRNQQFLEVYKARWATGHRLHPVRPIWCYFNSVGHETVERSACARMSYESMLSILAITRTIMIWSDISQRATKIFVGGLSPSVNDAELKEYFAQFGTIVEASVSPDFAATAKLCGRCESTEFILRHRLWWIKIQAGSVASVLFPSLPIKLSTIFWRKKNTQ